MKLGDRVQVVEEMTSFHGRFGTICDTKSEDGTVLVALDWIRLHPVRFAPRELSVQERQSAAPEES